MRKFKRTSKRPLFADVTVAMSEPLYTDFGVCMCGLHWTKHLEGPMPKCLFDPGRYTPRGGEESQRELLMELVRKVSRQIRGLRTRLHNVDFDAVAVRVKVADREVLLTRREVAQALALSLNVAAGRKGAV